MTREEAINEWILPALQRTWNEKKVEEILKALEQEPCEDAISRQAVLEAIEDDNRKGHYSCFASNNDAQCFKDNIRSLPFVTPKQKIGYWIIKPDLNPKCSECGKEPYYSNTIYDYKFCPYCGQPKMTEGDDECK